MKFAEPIVEKEWLDPFSGGMEFVTRDWDIVGLRIRDWEKKSFSRKNIQLRFELTIGSGAAVSVRHDEATLHLGRDISLCQEKKLN